MMMMKHLLKKLHIGGGGGGPLDDLRASNLPPIPARTPTSSSSSTGAMVDSGDRLSGGVGLARDSVGSRAMRGRSVGADEGLEDFSFCEEEYQVQLALAISVSDQDGRQDLDSAQINAAKRMSLGFAPISGGENLVEILSQRYRNFNVLNYDEKVMDGFYDLYGIIDSSMQERMPLLVDLQSATIADNVNYEVVVVDRTSDPALHQLETKAVSISMRYRAMGLGDPSESGLIQKISKLVVDSMGGPVTDADDMLKRWTLKNYELRTSLNTIVLPLGCLPVGLSRHRALLFKVLADRIGLPCKLVKGSYYTGIDEGAVNLIKIDDEKEYIIDLMGAPGALIPAEISGCLLQNAEFDLINSSSITQAVKDLSLAPYGIADWQLDGRRGVNGLSIDAYSGSKSVGSMAEESPKLGLRKTDNMSIEERKDTETFKHDFDKLLPLSKTEGKTSGSNQDETPVQKMKVSNTTKHVASAAKNSEFAQKLQAAQLESGASPSDLFSNINCLDGNEFQKNLDQELETKEEIYPRDRNFSPQSNVNFLPSLESELADCGSKGTHTQKEGTVQNIKDHHSESPYKNEEVMLHNICITETIQDSSSSFFPVVANDANALGGMQIYPDIESSKIDLENPISGTPLTVVKGITKNKEITAVLDEVAECEIPWDDLAIGERIGLGSYGEVHRADWNGTEVAVKKFLEQDLSGDALEQFRSEIKIMLRLRHPNVVLFMGAVTRPPNLSILTEFLPRGSLYKLLHRLKVQIDEKQRLRMALDVAKGMNYLHTSHPTIVHRDLKSPNLLVDKNWVVKVCDFGLSRLKHHTFLSSKSTAGTPEWMAPEVLRNERSNEKCDVYSFGVILWELATLCIPWSGMNPMQVVGAVGFQNRRLDIPKEVDPLVVDIICRCWDKNPDERPSFAQLMGQLKELERLTVEIS